MKLNGVRLELGEVEGVIASCVPLVSRAAALVVRGRLACAVQPASDGEALAECPLLYEATTSLLLLHARRWLPPAVSPALLAVLPSSFCEGTSAFRPSLAVLS